MFCIENRKYEIKGFTKQNIWINELFLKSIRVIYYIQSVHPVSTVDKSKALTLNKSIGVYITAVVLIHPNLYLT